MMAQIKLFYFDFKYKYNILQSMTLIIVVDIAKSNILLYNFTLNNVILINIFCYVIFILLNVKL